MRGMSNRHFGQRLVGLVNHQTDWRARSKFMNGLHEQKILWRSQAGE